MFHIHLAGILHIGIESNIYGSRFMVRAGEVHIRTQILLLVKVSKSNLEYVSNIFK